MEEEFRGFVNPKGIVYKLHSSSKLGFTTLGARNEQVAAQQFNTGKLTMGMSKNRYLKFSFLIRYLRNFWLRFILVSFNSARIKVHELREKSKTDLQSQLNEFKAELALLRVAKVTGGAPNKLSKMYVFYFRRSTHYRHIYISTIVWI